jgi:hypothetical protein
MLGFRGKPSDSGFFFFSAIFDVESGTYLVRHICARVRRCFLAQEVFLDLAI